MQALYPREFVETHGTDFSAWTLEDARAYTRKLSGAHYENFHVVSFLLPKRLHQDFFNVYAFCRWADDLGDEFGDRERSLELLGWWRRELDAVYSGRATHPVFVALAGTIEAHRLPQEPFRLLIEAFEQDQRVTRYRTHDQVLDYCVRSANPVGRLVLRLCGYADDERFRLSDATCTALQLANHWQDVRRDYFERDRIYVPQETLERHGASHPALEQALREGRATPQIQAAFRELVDEARKLFGIGLPLVDTLDRRLAVDIELFSRGGMAILDKIRRQDYDVVRKRPKIGKLERVGLLLKTLLRPRPANSS